MTTRALDAMLRPLPACNPDALGQLLQNFTIGKTQFGELPASARLTPPRPPFWTLARLTTSDTPLPGVSPALMTPLLPQPPPTAAPLRRRFLPSPLRPTFANGSPATSHPTSSNDCDHTGLRHQSPTGTSRRALGRTSANPIQTRVIGPGRILAAASHFYQ